MHGAELVVDLDGGLRAIVYPGTAPEWLLRVIAECRTLEQLRSLEEILFAYDGGYALPAVLELDSVKTTARSSVYSFRAPRPGDIPSGRMINGNPIVVRPSRRFGVRRAPRVRHLGPAGRGAVRTKRVRRTRSAVSSRGSPSSEPSGSPSEIARARPARKGARWAL